MSLRPEPQRQQVSGDVVRARAAGLPGYRVTARPQPPRPGTAQGLVRTVMPPDARTTRSATRISLELDFVAEVR